MQPMPLLRLEYVLELVELQTTAQLLSGLQVVVAAALDISEDCYDSCFQGWRWESVEQEDDEGNLADRLQ